MKLSHLTQIGISGIALQSGMLVAPLDAKPAPATAAVLNQQGEALKAKYTGMLTDLQQQTIKILPVLDERKVVDLKNAAESTQKAMAAVEAAQKNAGLVGSAKGLVDHAKGKWIGGAEKAIVLAKESLAKAKDATARATAEKELAKWEANRQEGLKALAERQAQLDEALKSEVANKKILDEANVALTKAKEAEARAAKSLMDQMAPVLAKDQMDAKLAKCVVLLHATPSGLASYASQGPEQALAVERLLSDDEMMKAMLVAGGARFGHYGRAMEIYMAIQKSSPRSKEGNLQRLALATALEHAKPIEQSHPASVTNGAEFIDPVKRYQHYEKAYLDGELDPSFKNFTVWEYRMVVNCDAPDEILQWGRTMLRNYRPDHILMNDYGWRYVSAVKTEVPYGSQNVQFDIPTQHQYQNIIKNGGVCGRRAFFGRFILKSFGIPTWGVTQKAHAALSHWTPKGWVVNLGAGFHASWWDKEEVSLSGTQFLLEAQARVHADEYIRVLRAQWVSRILGEQSYNERKKIAGGLWSHVALYQMKVLAESSSTLGPLGQDLAEANEREQKISSATVSKADTEISVNQGVITIPAAAHSKVSGKSAAMKSFSGGMQIHALGGTKAEYVVEVPRSGKYAITSRVATVQDGQQATISVNAAKPLAMMIPYTVGMWQTSAPVEVILQQGKNTIQYELLTGSRGVTIKEFALTPLK